MHLVRNGGVDGNGSMCETIHVSAAIVIQGEEFLLWVVEVGGAEGAGRVSHCLARSYFIMFPGSCVPTRLHGCAASHASSAASNK